jgi:hypothetical protein
MYLAYFDESGDSGPVPTSPTKFYVISCVLVHEAVWLNSLDLLVKIRRRLKTRFGIAVIPEIKATDFRRGQGPLRHLPWSAVQRAELFCKLLSVQPRLNVQTFAIAIDKSRLHAGRDVREVAWQYTLQRVDTFCRKQAERAVLFPDAGHGFFIRKLVRKLRRHQVIDGRFGGKLSIPSNRIVEDPNDRPSHDSYFIQLADWNAFAAHRSQYVDPRLVEFAAAWDSLGQSRLLPVNRVRQGINAPPGIVVYP